MWSEVHRSKAGCAYRQLHARGQAHAAADLVDELGVQSVTVVGHDFVGPVALAVTASRPDAVVALGLLATNAFTDTAIPFPLSTVAWPVIGPLAQRLLFASPFLRLMLRKGVGPGAATPDVASHLGDREQQRAIATIFAGSLTRLAELYRPIEETLRSLQVPVFVGWGDHDPFFRLAHGERTANAAGTKLRTYAGAGHLLPHERPQEVAADILALVPRNSVYVGLDRSLWHSKRLGLRTVCRGRGAGPAKQPRLQPDLTCAPQPAARGGLRGR